MALGKYDDAEQQRLRGAPQNGRHPVRKITYFENYEPLFMIFKLYIYILIFVNLNKYKIKN